LQYLGLGRPRTSLFCISCDFGKKLDELPVRGLLLVLLKYFGPGLADILNGRSFKPLFHPTYASVNEPTELTKAPSVGFVSGSLVGYPATAWSMLATAKAKGERFNLGHD
jgi:hypothetical protein